MGVGSGQGLGLRSRAQTGPGRLDRMRWDKWWRGGFLGTLHRAHWTCRLYQFGVSSHVVKTRWNSGPFGLIQ